jgi:NADH dehydrogenase (ubiquinone) flavoprotein 2
MSRYPSNYKASATMPLLFIAQEQNDNWLPLSAMNKVAEMLDLPPIRVYETATFYTMYNRKKLGKYHIQLCGTTPCMLCGAQEIKKSIMKAANVTHEGEISKDGLFTVDEVECLGACANAPMIQVNNHEFYENLTPETSVKLIENWKAGKPNKVGPQNHQRTAEGPLGQTTLLSGTPPTSFRDIDALLKEEAAKAEAAKKAAAEKAAAEKK